MASVLLSVCRASYSARVRWLHAGTGTTLLRHVTVAVCDDRRKLTPVQFEGEKERRFHGVWLRHNCRCPVCYSHDNYMSLVSYKQLIGVELSSARVQGAPAHHVHHLHWSALITCLQETRLLWIGSCKTALLTQAAFLWPGSRRMTTPCLTPSREGSKKQSH